MTNFSNKVLIFGGWPRASMQSPKVSLDRAFDYYDAIVNIDIQRVDNTSRNPERVKRLMRSFARFQGAQTSLATICQDIKLNDDKSLAKKINTDKMKEPSFMMVLTGTNQYAYQREDGIAIVPIGCLKD